MNTLYKSKALLVAILSVISSSGYAVSVCVQNETNPEIAMTAIIATMNGDIAKPEKTLTFEKGKGKLICKNGISSTNIKVTITENNLNNSNSIDCTNNFTALSPGDYLEAIVTNEKGSLACQIICVTLTTGPSTLPPRVVAPPPAGT